MSIILPSTILLSNYSGGTSDDVDNDKSNKIFHESKNTRFRSLLLNLFLAVFAERFILS